MYIFYVSDAMVIKSTKLIPYYFFTCRMAIPLAGWLPRRLDGRLYDYSTMV